jgi:hypothetical protein
MSCHFSHFNAADRDPPATFFEVLYFLQLISEQEHVHFSTIGLFAKDVHTGNPVVSEVYCLQDLTEASSPAVVDSWDALHLLHATGLLTALRWRSTFAVDPCRRKQPES